MQLVLRSTAVVVHLVLLVCALSLAADATAAEPDLADYSYGPHERQVLDIWQADALSPTPLVAYFHGGGFRQGDKRRIRPALVAELLRSGISVMAVNYRLTPQAKFPEHYLDCARAIQTARLNSAAWNIDPTRVAATGSSAGGVISLWLAFHDDLADPQSADPLLRESTRLRCAAVFRTPTSLDPHDVGRWVGETALEHRFFRGAFFGVGSDAPGRDDLARLFLAASPLTHLTADDPPVWAYYTGPKDVPADISLDGAIHHYNFGLQLKRRMERLGLTCEVVHDGDGRDRDASLLAFLLEHFE